MTRLAGTSVSAVVERAMLARVRELEHDVTEARRQRDEAIEASRERGRRIQALEQELALWRAKGGTVIGGDNPTPSVREIVAWLRAQRRCACLSEGFALGRHAPACPQPVDEYQDAADAIVGANWVEGR